MYGSNGALILNRSGGIFRITDDSSLAYGTGSRPIFINNGTFAKTGGTGTSSVGWTFQNYGNVDAMSGTIKFVDYTQYAGNTRLLGGNLATTYANKPLNFQGGALTGTGKIDGRAVINGVFAPVGLGPPPGGGGAAVAAAVAGGGSAGKIEITGGLVLQGGANLMMRIGGTAPGSSDFVQVDSDATLAGLLSLSFMNAYQDRVTPSDVITLLTAATTLTGGFSDVANGGRLETTDGYGSFQVNYGSGSQFDPDSVVLSNFLASINVQSVPEPPSLVLVVLGAVGVFCYAWRSRRPGQARGASH